MKKENQYTAFNLIGFIAVVIILILASCNKKDIPLPKKQTYYIRVGAVNNTDTIYSKIIKVS